MKQGDAFSIMQNALKAAGYGAELVIDGKWGKISHNRHLTRSYAPIVRFMTLL